LSNGSNVPTIDEERGVNPAEQIELSEYHDTSEKQQQQHQQKVSPTSSSSHQPFPANRTSEDQSSGVDEAGTEFDESDDNDDFDIETGDPDDEYEEERLLGVTHKVVALTIDDAPSQVRRPTHFYLFTP
jgi:U3 small nucleolar RNA-associated protein 14